MPQIYLQRLFPNRSFNCPLRQQGLNSMCWSYRLTFLAHVLEGEIVRLCLFNPWALDLWYYERRKIWFKNKNKIRVVFWALFWDSKWSYKFFSSTFLGSPYGIFFFPDFFLFMFPKVMDSHLRYWDIYITFQDEEIWGLNYSIPPY